MDEKQAELAEGNIAPDFMMRSREGKTIKLSELRGKKNVVVYFYPKDFTSGCSMEATEFSRDYKKFTDTGIEIVGISPDDEESHQKFREKMGMPYPESMASRASWEGSTWASTGRPSLWTDPAKL